MSSDLKSRSVAECRRAIQERNHDLRALIAVLETPLRDERASPSAPLFGVPYVLKDTWNTAGIRTTGGSWRHRTRVPSSSSVVFTTFQEAGAVLLGKSNLCDLAFSPESDNHILGATRNPLDAERTSGGSTGGGAAAIAAGMAAFDWGSDFGGSVRMPAAFCGIVGLRLSYEEWPIPDDFFPRTPKLDVELHGMGPLARSVGAVRDVMRAAESLRKSPLGEARPFTGRVHIYPPDAATERHWPTFVGDVARALVSIGAGFEVDRSVPSPSAVTDAYDSYVCSNFESFLATGELPLRQGLPAVLLGLASGGRFDRRIHPKSGMLFMAMAVGRVSIYRDTRVARERVDRVRDAMSAIWDRGDLVVAPTATEPAPRHGRAGFSRRLLAFAKLGNMTDSTCVAIPFGRFPNGLPRSLQVMGPPGSEHEVLDFAARLEGL
jgi:Asp-tRNA(Asn)/Glu-tRNA(Gln) amidotransferase A subunit family amidase